MGIPSAVVVGVGAERGIGAAVCRRFASEGYHVFVAGRSESKITRACESIRAAGRSAEPVTTDTTSEKDVVALFDRAMGPGAGKEPAEVVVFNSASLNRPLDFRELHAAVAFAIRGGDPRFQDLRSDPWLGGFLINPDPRAIAYVSKHDAMQFGRRLIRATNERLRSLQETDDVSADSDCAGLTRPDGFEWLPDVP